MVPALVRGALVLAVGCLVACRAEIQPGLGRMAERGKETWTVEGNPVTIDRTYFQSDGSQLAFVTEWTCTECAPQKKLTDPEAFELARPVLWEAVVRKEPMRATVSKFGTGPLTVDRLVSAMSYRLGDAIEVAGIVVDRPEALYDWTWQIGDKTFRVFQPGYYFDTEAKQLYFTIQWHDEAVCSRYETLTQESATSYALPVMKEAARRRLFDSIPRVGNLPDVSDMEIWAIGVGIACPEPSCAGQPGCPIRSYRTFRPLTELATD
jgi:hypothetical protein